MKFGCLLIFLSFVFPLIATERSESHVLENTEKEEHTVPATQDKEESNSYYATNNKNKLNLPYPKNFLGSLIGWNHMITETQKAEIDEIVKCTSKVVDAIITYQLNDKCNKEENDGNFEKAVFGCCKDNNLSYCTSIDQLEKFNGHTTTKGEKRVCLDEKKKESLEKVFRNISKKHDVPVATPDNYNKEKSIRSSEDNDYFVYSEHTFRCKPGFSLDLDKKVEECCENGGGDECRVENVIKSECERMPTEELQTEKDSSLVETISHLCQQCFCQGALSVLWGHPELILTNSTIRQLFKDVNLHRMDDFYEFVSFSMEDSPILKYKPEDTENPSHTCDKPE